MKTFSLGNVYENIKTDCEHNNWEVFYDHFRHKYLWKERFDLPDLNCIRIDHPNWYKWLLEKGLVEEEKKVPEIGIGMRIPKGALGSNYAEECIIAQVGRLKIATIGLKSGNRYAPEPVKVGNIYNISLEEFRETLGSVGNKVNVVKLFSVEEIASKLLPRLEE